MDDRFGSGVLVGGIIGAATGAAVTAAGWVGLLIAAGIFGAVGLLLRSMFAAADESRF